MDSCKFKGIKADVASHLKDCRYESMKEVLNEKEEQIQQLQDMILHRNDQLDSLQRLVDSLAQRVDKLEKSIVLFATPRIIPTAQLNDFICGQQCQERREAFGGRTACGVASSRTSMLQSSPSAARRKKVC